MVTLEEGLAHTRTFNTTVRIGGRTIGFDSSHRKKKSVAGALRCAQALLNHESEHTNMADELLVNHREGSLGKHITEQSEKSLSKEEEDLWCSMIKSLKLSPEPIQAFVQFCSTTQRQSPLYDFASSTSGGASPAAAPAQGFCCVIYQDNAPVASGRAAKKSAAKAMASTRALIATASTSVAASTSPANLLDAGEHHDEWQFVDVSSSECFRFVVLVDGCPVAQGMSSDAESAKQQAANAAALVASGR
jgi:dsRNA-specific ribonuclease